MFTKYLSRAYHGPVNRKIINLVGIKSLEVEAEFGISLASLCYMFEWQGTKDEREGTESTRRRSLKYRPVLVKVMAKN